MTKRKRNSDRLCQICRRFLPKKFIKARANICLKCYNLKQVKKQVSTKVDKSKVVHLNQNFVYFFKESQLWRGRISKSSGHHRLFAREIKRVDRITRNLSDKTVREIQPFVKKNKKEVI